MTAAAWGCARGVGRVRKGGSDHGVARARVCVPTTAYCISTTRHSGEYGLPTKSNHTGDSARSWLCCEDGDAVAGVTTGEM